MAKTEINARYIKDFVTEQKKRTQPLRDRFNSDFTGLWQPTGFAIDQNKGNYRSVTSNRPRVWADKITSELAYAGLDFEIPLAAKPGSELRKRCSMTERAVYGLLAMADEELVTRLFPSLQATFSWQLPVRGWVVPRVWLFEEDGELHIDIAPWDILNTYWAMDRKGLAEVVYVRYGSKKEIDDAYGVESKEDSQGRVEVNDYWNREKEIISVPSVEKGIVDSQKHNKGYIPIGLFPVGSTPMVQGENDTDTIKHQGESCFARIRHIAPLLSELETYYLTTIALGTHTPLIKEYDSTKGQEPEFDANPYATGAAIPVDIGKGQKVYPMFQPTTPKDALTLYQMVLADFSIATGPDVMYGQSPGQLTAQGTAMLLRAAAASMKDCTRGMERVYGWVANEIIKQFKDGDFGDMELQGVDGKQIPFTVKIKRDDLVTDHRVMATLRIDAPQDKLTLSGILGQYFKDGIISKQTYRDKTGEVPDTDAEQEIIDREQAEELSEVKMFRLLKELIDEKDFVGAKAVWLKIQQTMAQLQPQQPQGNGGSPNMPMVPKGMSPRTMNQPPQMPTNLEDVRLAQMGLQRGK